MGLRVAGVDMLEGNDGPLVMEVNSSPGLEGIERATGLDVAGAIIDYVANQVAFPELDVRQRLTVSTGYGVAELLVRADGDFVGKTIGDAGLRDRDITVLTLHRDTDVIPNPRESRLLEANDRLLCFGNLESMPRDDPGAPATTRPGSQAARASAPRRRHLRHAPGHRDGPSARYGATVSVEPGEIEAARAGGRVGGQAHPGDHIGDAVGGHRRHGGDQGRESAANGIVQDPRCDEQVGDTRRRCPSWCHDGQCRQPRSGVGVRRAALRRAVSDLRTGRRPDHQDRSVASPRRRGDRDRRRPEGGRRSRRGTRGEHRDGVLLAVRRPRRRGRPRDARPRTARRHRRHRDGDRAAGWRRPDQRRGDRREVGATRCSGGRRAGLGVRSVRRRFGRRGPGPDARRRHRRQVPRARHRATGRRWVDEDRDGRRGLDRRRDGAA